MYNLIMNHYPVTVVDNFYKNPDEVRELALNQNYKSCSEIKGLNYTFPGSRTDDTAKISQDFHQKFFTKFSSFFHNYNHDQLRMVMTSNFQYVPESFNKGVIHRDVGAIFAGLIYLSKNPKLDSGTTLFKKNKKYDEEKFIKVCKSNDKLFMDGKYNELDYSYEVMFDEFIKINNSYNTLIMYEADIFHAANKFFGTNKDNSRLTQVFFVHKIESKRSDSFPIDRANLVNI